MIKYKTYEYATITIILKKVSVIQNERYRNAPFGTRKTIFLQNFMLDEKYPIFLRNDYSMKGGKDCVGHFST